MFLLWAEPYVFANLLVPPTKTSERHEQREKKANLKNCRGKSKFGIVWIRGDTSILGECLVLVAISYAGGRNEKDNNKHMKRGSVEDRITININQLLDMSLLFFPDLLVACKDGSAVSVGSP